MWLANNKLKENTEKAIEVIFSNRRARVAPTSASFLAVLFDDALRLDDHCIYLSRKLNCTVFVTRNLKSEVSLPVLDKAYFTLFGSYLGYRLIAWDSSAGSARIFSLQRKVVRIMTNLCYVSGCRAQFKQLVY